MALSIDRGDGRTELTAMPAELDEARRITVLLNGSVQRVVMHGDSDTVELSGDLVDIVRAVLTSLGQGGSITVGGLPETLTTTAAASMLDISRPTLMQLIHDEVIPSHKKGAHHRLLTKDVVEYLRVQRDKQREAYDKLRDLLD